MQLLDLEGRSRKRRLQGVGLFEGLGDGDADGGRDEVGDAVDLAVPGMSSARPTSLMAALGGHGR